MESITRIVSESLARHGFNRPLDYRRLHWSGWFRWESPHSLLLVPSKPGVFALAEEITAGLGSNSAEETAKNPPAVTAEGTDRGTEDEAPAPRRMLAVTQFFEDDDMAFVLSRMLSARNPMRARLLSGRYFVRFVVIEDECQRRSICHALNQWIAGFSERVSGIGAHFATSLELQEISVARTLSSAPASGKPAASPAAAPQLGSGAVANIHCPAPFPSGF
jgi:hypothetical protein